MSQDSLQFEFDRLSRAVDSAQYERLRWAKEDAPVLAKLVALAQSAIEDRSDFELTEEGASSDIKRFILKIHGNRMIGITMWLEAGLAQIRAEDVQRSKYTLEAGNPVSTEYAGVNEQWMADALQELFSRIRT